MRLKSVFISKYKNLSDFRLDFDNDNFLNIFVGKNGTGKSNFFEALIEIFNHLYNHPDTSSIPVFSYSIEYEVNSEVKTISWESGKLKFNGRQRKTMRNIPLPDNVLIYYSGHNETVKDLIRKYEEQFSKRIKNAKFGESRRFIGIGSDYKELLLAVILIQEESNKARQFICRKLGIESVGSELKLELKRPNYAIDKTTGRDNPAFDIQNNDESDRYWKAEGITKDFLDRLTKCASPAQGSLVRDEGYFSATDRYILYFDISKIKQEFCDLSLQELFRYFDNLKVLNMLANISLPITISNDLETKINNFSDGQFQSAYIYSVIELFKDQNCITLLDEPDSFLHPEWQYEFLSQIFEITENLAQKNHVLMSSHNAMTLCPLEEQNISFFKIDNSVVSHEKRSKHQIVNELSNSLIQYSEDESKLLINNVIRSSDKPILFVEGVSDVSILNTAYTKIYGTGNIPILIQDAFDRGFLKTLFKRGDIFGNYPDKLFCALFDFDDAYHDWRQLGGEYEIEDIEKGLCRKLSSEKAYAFLLPVPDNELREQVYDQNNPIEKIIPKPHFCIEHVFYKVPGLDSWFNADQRSGNIKFKGDRHKVKFAEEVVPTIDKAYFEVFRPLFEFISSKQ
jgi:energy-coupling factor transporter ATP-binding protein EcfA2